MAQSSAAWGLGGAVSPQRGPGEIGGGGRAGSVKSLGEIERARAGCAPAWIRHSIR